MRERILARVRVLAGLRAGMPPRLGLVTLGAVALWRGTSWTSFSDGAHGRMWQVVPGLALVCAGMACLALAGIRLPVSVRWRQLYAHCRWVVLAAGLIMSLLTVVVLDSALYNVLKMPTSSVYLNDVISFTAVDARAALAGRNPYTDASAFTTAVRAYPQALPTPLHRGTLAASEDYPTRVRLQALTRAYLRAPQTLHGELDPATVHSYPALSFLLYVPFVWAGMSDILLLHVLVYCLLFAWLVWLAPAGQRAWAALAAGAALIGFYSLAIDFEVICVAFILAAWHWRERRWLSALALGLGCAFKQYCWFFAPFLLLEALYAHGWREALRRAGIALAAFVAPNLPYMIASPGAWAHSLLLPVAAPLFPMGIGPISLSTGHLLPYGPTALYTVLEVTALAALLWVQWRWREGLGAAVLVLALVPLLFAFRSPSNYFAFAPWLALYAVCTTARAARQPASAAATTPSIPAMFVSSASGIAYRAARYAGLV